MRRKVQFRISDETGANVSSLVPYALRAGANITSGGDTSISASGGTGTIRATHPGMLKSGDKVYWRNTSGTVTDEMVLTANPSYNAGGYWEVAVRNDTGSDISVGTTGRLVLTWTESGHMVTVYNQDAGGTSTTGVLSVSSTTGEVRFFVDEPDVDIAVTQLGSLSGYEVDVPTERRDYVTPEEFGAVGDGSTDDSAAIQDAVNYSALFNLGPVQFDAKTYLINTAIDVSDTVCLKGKTSSKLGTNSTKITRTSTNKLFTIGGTSGNNAFRIRIEDIWFNGGDTDQILLDFTYCSFLHIARCKFNGTTNYGLDMTTCWEVFVDDCDFSFLGDTGGTYSAVRLEDCNNMRWRGCHFESIPGKAFTNVANGGDSGTENCNLIFFDDCKFESTTSVLSIIDFNTVLGIYIRAGIFSWARTGSTSTCPSYLNFVSCRWINIQADMTFLSSNPGVTTPDLTNFIALDSAEGVYIDIHIENGADVIAGTEMVNFTNNTATEAHQFVRVTYLPGLSPSAARTNLAGAHIQDSVIFFNDTNTQIASYAGSPNSNVTGNVGDVCLDTSNGDLYVKESGAATNTGWVLAATVSGFTMTGNLDMGGNNLTNVGQISGINKTVSWSASDLGNAGTDWVGGFYIHDSGSNDFNPSVTWGTANGSYAAHVYFVTAAGATDTQITVTGTSITDGGTRTAADTEVVSLTDGSANVYYETSKKFIGQVTIEKTAGTDRLCNYGWAKYWDHFNKDFTVTDFEATWSASLSDSGFNVELYHHKTTGWTYNAGGTATPPTPITSLQTVHNTEYELIAGQTGAFKRTGLSTAVSGSASEGVLVAVTTGTNNSLNYINLDMQFTD